MNLTQDISSLPNTHSKTVSRLRGQGVETLQDLLMILPKRYKDYSRIVAIDTLQEGETVTIIGKVVKSANRYVRRNFSIQEVTLTDGTGELKLVWFNQPYMVRNLKVEATLAVAGEIEKQGTKLIMKPSEYEQVPPHTGEEFVTSQFSNTKLLVNGRRTMDNGLWTFIHTGRIVPVYSQRGGVSSRLVREKIAWVLANIPITNVSDWFPPHILQAHTLLTMSDAVQSAHAPASMNEAQLARHRFAFDELFTLHLANTLIRKQWKEQSVRYRFTESKEGVKQLHDFVSSLPFTLTHSQQQVWEQIYSDLLAGVPMNRFLQGDVGSGKTVVAALASYMAHLNGYRTLFMCPTEILAQQHYATLQTLFAGTNITIDLVTGTSNSHKLRCTNYEKKTKNSDLVASSIKHPALSTQHSSIVVGTHALISNKHTFDNVGLVIIDEQHRFGVVQRALLKSKTSSALTGAPHLLTMTATPIPRTIALTLFGDLDVSVLTDMPTGRMPVKTYLAPSVKREKAYSWIEKQIQESHCQVFVVCPRITDEQDEENETEGETISSLKAAEKEVVFLQKEIFPTLRVGLLHGKMKAKEKEEIMNKFRERQFDILVTTTVVEVGIDIPNATIMVIEGAERYGLAQLHQLRGRVGRGSGQSYCVLFTSDGVTESERLTFFAKTTQGMELAEYDFRRRGPGDIYGTAQHGVGELDIANLFDFALVSETQQTATEFAREYSPEKYPLVAERLEKYADLQIAKD